MRFGATRGRTAVVVSIAAIFSFWWAIACGGTLSSPRPADDAAPKIETVEEETGDRDEESPMMMRSEVVVPAEMPAAPVPAPMMAGPTPVAPAPPPAVASAPRPRAMASAPPRPRAIPRRFAAGKRHAPRSSLDDLLAGASSARVMKRKIARSRAHGIGGMGGLRRTAAIAGSPRMNTENYAHIRDNNFLPVLEQPLSTFSIDVDTASYANMRRFIDHGQRPPADAVRIEELINYFTYRYPEPTGRHPFSVYTEVASAPWNPEHRLLHIGLKGRSLRQDKVPPRNLVFLIDVSGSMRSYDKLPLLKRGLSMLTRQMRRQDRIAMVVYAGSSGVVLESTAGDRQGDILAALERLQAGGSTHGSAGIELAYQLAQENFIKGGINRVLLATDGDFNVGVTSEGALTRLIEQKRRTGVFLTVLGFGRGNLKDSRMEMLSNKGNGNYAYIDSIAEARKVLVREAGATLVTIAKDVKLQLEFNPALVKSYRLIGYENRILAARDFNDDRKDAGEIGAGHTVTALYELVLTDGARGVGVDPLKYQSPRRVTGDTSNGELVTVKLRYKRPNGLRSKLISTVVRDSGAMHGAASEDFRWSAAVAGFGMVLRNSIHRGDASFELVHALAEGAIGDDLHGDRAQALSLMRRAALL